ncbi:MAG: 6-bladed beta-propeller [Bacteroides sp.]|nr:6-bladed beta-propeller [Bacteroides sp.]
MNRPITTIMISAAMMLMTTGCGSNSKNNHADGTMGNIPVIDFRADYPEKRIDIREIADIEYIPLEMTDSSLLSRPRLTMTDYYIVAYNIDGNIIIFNRDGSYSHSFNHCGNGPQEYSSVARVIIDLGNLDIFTQSYSGLTIQQYDFYGKHIRTITLPEKLRHGQELFFYDKKTLLGVDQSYNDIEEMREQYGVNRHPFYYVDITTDSITDLPIEMVDPISDMVTWFGEGESAFCILLRIAPLSTIGDKIIVSDAMEDNISIFADGTLVPIVAKRNKLSENEKPYLTTIDGMNDRYILLHTMEKNIDIKANSAPDPVQYLYDHKTEEWVKVKMANSDIELEGDPDYYYGRLSGSIHALPEGYMAQVILAETLCDLRDKGRLSGRLKELSENMDYEDNPIVLLARLKN